MRREEERDAGVDCGGGGSCGLGFSSPFFRPREGLIRSIEPPGWVVEQRQSTAAEPGARDGSVASFFVRLSRAAMRRGPTATEHSRSGGRVGKRRRPRSRAGPILGGVCAPTREPKVARFRPVSAWSGAFLGGRACRAWWRRRPGKVAGRRWGLAAVRAARCRARSL